MIVPHIPVNFKFNDESLRWLNENLTTIKSDFDKDFPEEGGLIYNNKIAEASIEFQSTPPAVYVGNFLNSLGLTSFHVQMFLYKVSDKKSHIENIHIDNPGRKALPGRFNVLVEGNTNSKMHWWNVDPNDSKITRTDVPQGGQRWQILGNLDEQLALLGQPDYSSDSLSKIQETGDFVRTDIAHAIQRDGERRVLISTQIFHPWEEITDKVQKWKNQ